MKAVVMAGGEGTRLRPLTSNQPKPMVPIVGKPCIEHILELLGKHGFQDVIVTVAFLPQAIRSYLGNGEALGMNIEYSVEESPLGTAGSVRLADFRELACGPCDRRSNAHRNCRESNVGRSLRLEWGPIQGRRRGGAHSRSGNREDLSLHARDDDSRSRAPLRT